MSSYIDEDFKDISGCHIINLTICLWKHVEGKHTHTPTSDFQRQCFVTDHVWYVRQDYHHDYTLGNTVGSQSLRARMIAIDTLPFSFIEAAGFKKLMAFVERGYVAARAKTIKNSAVQMFETIQKFQ